MELDGTRYRLAAQSSRTSWSRRLQKALAVTLDAAYREQDHAFTAELLEFARVQAVPAITGEASDDVALSTPPVVQLRGRSRLARPGEQHRPQPVSLEAATERAAGRGGWWLSFWEADEWLYWSLMPPKTAAIRSGRTSIGSRSDLAHDLAMLQDALPLLQPDEDLPTADFRIACSPLLSDPAAELRLSARLGSHLLPPELVAAARQPDRESQRLSVAIAPSPSLGYVPWSLLAAPRSDGGYDRLLELCNWVLAPSAALVVQAPGGTAVKRTPLALVVADTTVTPSLGPLAGARSQAAALPRSVTVLGGRHWTQQVATVAAFEDKLRDLGPDITVAFLCHAIRGTSEEPSRGGLIMAAPESQFGEDRPPAEDFEVLSPITIFRMVARGVQMPAQVLLQACDTSALSDADSGEWLTLAPALLAGGTREVVATLYPMPDLATINDPVVDAAISGTSLCDALRLMQRSGLRGWEGGKTADSAHAPLLWAGYAPICVQSVNRDETDRDGRGPEIVSARFINIVAQAIKESRESRSKHFHSGFLLSAVLDRGGIADLFDGGTNSLRPSTFVWTLGPHIFSRFLHFRDGPARELVLDEDLRVRVSQTLIAAFGSACQMAARDGVLVEPEHLLQAALAPRSAARRILAVLSALTRRHVELTTRAVAHVLAETICRGQKPSTGMTSPSPQDRLAQAFVDLCMTGSPNSQSVAAAPDGQLRSPGVAPTLTAISEAVKSSAGGAQPDAMTDRDARGHGGGRERPASEKQPAGVRGQLAFERFTDDANEAVQSAVEAARSLEHDRVDTGHLLIGILVDGRTIASQALRTLGVDLSSVRHRVADAVGRPPAEVPTPIPFTRAAKETLQLALALREAVAEKATKVSSAHILLALTTQEQSGACRVMRELGTFPATVRTRVKDGQSRDSQHFGLENLPAP